MNDPSQQHIGTPALIRRFAPYLMRYKRILIFDLFCAALTTLCDIVLPKIMSYLTNAATDPGIVLTVDAVLKLALLYLILRLIDGAAQYFMSGTGHIMGVHAAGCLCPPAAVEPHLLFQYQSWADHGPHYQRPV